MGRRIYTREYLMKKMKEYVNLYGIPKTREFDKKEGFPSTHSYRKEFGTFSKAIEECGFKLDEKTLRLRNRRQYTKEELLNMLKIETENKLNNGKITLLTNDDIDNIKTMPSDSLYLNTFGSIKEAYKLIGINYDEFNKNAIEDDMKNKYLEIKKLSRQVPHSRLLDKYSKMDNNKYYSSSTYISHFGSIKDLQILMGDKPTNYSENMADEEMLNGLVKLKDELGIVPTQKEVKICNYCGCPSDYSKRFGSFVEAIYKAGMTPRSEKKVLRTEKGNLALSGYEFKFLKFLEKYNIRFYKEEMYKKYIKGFNKGYKFDFTLHIDNKVLFVKIFGITGNKNYDNKIKEKIKLCKENNLNLLSLYPNDIINNNFEDFYSIVLNKLNSNKDELKEIDK